jgi:drug/metabolite transporter (DMT)-like permease
VSNMNNYLGEISALLTAIFWTISALAFESASLKVGSLAVNIIRLFLGFIFISIFTFFIRNGLIFPTDAGIENWFWLILSGLVGFLFGDLFLFKSFTLIGSRFAMLFMSLAPPITAFFGWIILGEKLTLFNYLGMLLTLTGISIAIFNRDIKNTNKISLKLAPKGILFALAGATGQALGLVLSKFGMKGYNPFAAAQIRIIAGTIGFVVLVTILRRWRSVLQAFYQAKAMRGITIGSFFGPFLGVSFSLLAIKYTETGIASTIMTLVPVLIILPAVIFYKEKITFLETLGAIISVCGVGLFFIK